MNNTGLFENRRSSRSDSALRGAVAALALAALVSGWSVMAMAQSGLPPAQIPPAGMQDDIPGPPSAPPASLSEDGSPTAPNVPQGATPAPSFATPDGLEAPEGLDVPDMPSAPDMTLPDGGIAPDAAAPLLPDELEDESIPAPAAPPVRRKDNVFGTMDEGLRMGTDPDSGANSMRIEPVPPPKQPDFQMPNIEVSPKLELPARNQ